MENFEYFAPTYFAFGKGQEVRTGELVKRFGGTKVLLHFGGGSVKRNGVYDAVTASLRASNLSFVELGGVQPNPRSGLIYEGIELCRREGVDFILAIGGGSAIDSAKSIALGVPYEGDFWDFFSGKAPIVESLPVGTVLTIPAAGSEGSNSAVVTHEEGNLKWGIPKSDVVRPRFAIMNPEFTFGLPAYQTACGITDIMAHLCERYFTNTESVSITDKLCEAVMKTMVEAAPKVIENPEDYEARGDIMWCGTLAHNNSCGIGRAQDWASHQIEHEISAFNDCAHGAGLAVIMPAWMELVMTHDIPRFAQFAVRVWGCDMNFANPEETAKQGIARFRAFLDAIGMPSSLKQLQIMPADFEALIAHRRSRGFPFGAFVPIGQEEMKEILKLADR